MARKSTYRDIVVIGASAGSVTSLSKLVSTLPPTFRASVFVVTHTSPHLPSYLANILSRAGPLRVEVAGDGTRFQPGRIYTAQPDRHLMLEDGRTYLNHGPRENNFRPAIDALFRSAAVAHGDRVIGVILSGGLDDGSYGLLMIKRRGGIAIVQDPTEAIIDSMPRSAIETVDVDLVLPVTQIGSALVHLTEEPVKAMAQKKSRKQKRAGPTRLASDPDKTNAEQDSIGTSPPIFSCPECGGTLRELHEGRFWRYRCHVGHTFTPESLLNGQENGVEYAMWSSVRALKEKVELQRRLARRSRSSGLKAVAKAYEAQADEAEKHAESILKVLISEPRKRLSGDNGSHKTNGAKSKRRK